MLDCKNITADCKTAPKILAGQEWEKAQRARWKSSQVQIMGAAGRTVSPARKLAAILVVASKAPSRHACPMSSCRTAAESNTGELTAMRRARRQTTATAGGGRAAAHQVAGGRTRRLGGGARLPADRCVRAMHAQST
jgi:hypothetical protein